ncbi:ankyrin-3-like [Microplitis demolitor]|uniref:ankyrin-3-like n=1 Tax=Microplitis demolitor TaxID=69319 RepID=UPI00235B6927|nr:ankyrin-3-like [Microplitis demolitor]
MSSVTSSGITSSIQVRDEDENYDLIETLNKSGVSVVSTKNRFSKPAFEYELGKVSESLRKNGVELIIKSICLVGGSLKYAVRIGDIKLVKLRIRQGVNVNSSGRKGSSPLHLAAWYGHPKIIKLLINNGARLDSVLNGPIKNGFTPLHLACLNNKVKCVKVLLKYGASVTPKCADVHHPIHIAVFKNYVKIAALLLDNGADVNLRFNNKFFHNKWDQPIFWKDMDLTLLHCSIARKDDEMTALLLEHRADIHLNTRSNKTSLMHAVEANDPKLVESFLAKGANPNDRDIYGEPVLFYLVVNANNQSIYYSRQEFYSDLKKLKIIELLYAAGADVNVKFGSNKSYDSLVHYTCMYGHLSVTGFILLETNFDCRNINYAEIFNWVGSNPAQKNIKDAERIIAAGHLLKCGKNIESINSDVVTFSALCLQTSHLKEKPHEIEGSVSKSKKILSLKCSCKAGKGTQCKHVVAALLYCYRKGNQLDQEKIVKEYNSTPILQHACFSKVKRKYVSSQNVTEDPVAANNSLSQQDADEDLDDVYEGEVYEEVVSTSVIKRKCPEWIDVKKLTEDEKKLIVEKVRTRLKDSAFSKH